MVKAQAATRADVVEWRSAAPFWDISGAGGRMRGPNILRFAEDDFMERFQDMLSRNDAEALAALPARFERHDTEWPPEPSARILKLYQPVHGRFYLVCGSLICIRTGLPDHVLDPAAGQKASFLLRRLVPRESGVAVDPRDPSTYLEAAWITAPTALYGKGWLSLRDPAVIKAGEERNPMFPLAAPVPGRQKPRRVHAGLLSTSSRETYRAGPESRRVLPPGEDAGGDPNLPRKLQFETRFANPVLSLAGNDGRDLAPERAREVALFALLDLGEYLGDFVPEVSRAILGRAAPSSLGTPQRTLFDDLASRSFVAASGARRAWTDALREAEALRSAATDPDTNLDSFPWFDFRSTSPAVDPAGMDALTRKVVAALAPASECGPCQAVGGAPEVPKFDPEAGAFYVVRCLFERPNCQPWEGPVLGEPGEPFQIAPFLDPDAPFRPVRIPMPVDTSIQGLRKFPKTVAFMLSDRLRNQMERMRGITKDLDFKGEESFTLGIICSLSIPIITLCALVLLLIIVQLLNIVFWWMPFLKICFPIPLKARP